MTLEEAVRALEQEPVPPLPDPGRMHSPAEYLSFIAQVIHATHHTVWNTGSTDCILPCLKRIGALAVSALENNGKALGLSICDRDWIYSAATPPPGLAFPRGAIEYLLDIESIVLRYKAHRPQLRSPEAAPKVAANLIEILALVLAALKQHG